MGFVTFNVRFDGLSPLLKAMAENATEAEHAVAQQVKKDTAPFVPMMTGSQNQRTRVDGNLVIYEGPYARFLYHGKVMIDPDTGSTYAPKGGTKVVTDRNLVFNTASHAQAQAYWFEASKAQNVEKWAKVAGKAMKKWQK